MRDRIKPHNTGAEMALLGCMLLKRDALQEVLADFPNAESLFYDDRHAAIFAAMRDANSNDPVAIYELLRNRQHEVGGLPYISGLGNNAAMGGSDEVKQYAAMLVRDYTRRKLIEAATMMERDAFESEDAANALENAERSVMEIGATLQSDSDPTLATLVDEAIAEFEDAFENKGKIRGLSVGFSDFDWMTHGLKGGQMVVLAARPGVGKTSLAMNMAESVAVDQKFPTGVFSLEMTGKELIYRMACSRSRIDSKRAQEGDLLNGDLTRLTSTLGQIKKSPLFISEKGGLTISQLSARARRMHQRHKLKLLVIDYLQLMQSRIKGNRNEQITEISNGVKALAKDLRIPIIVLSQLSREVEKGEREPRLSDLRDSGSIEQDADIVILLSPKPKKDPEATMIEVEAIIPKHRGGPTGSVDLIFNPSLTRFEQSSPVQDVP
jgi:replicative DNA helicase